MMPPGPLPLDEIRVLELSGPVGSYGGRLLADASADVVLLTPPVVGFDPDSRELSWAAPDAVVCAITPFGLTGPYRS